MIEIEYKHPVKLPQLFRDFPMVSPESHRYLFPRGPYVRIRGGYQAYVRVQGNCITLRGIGDPNRLSYLGTSALKRLAEHEDAVFEILKRACLDAPGVLAVRIINHGAWRLLSWFFFLCFFFLLIAFIAGFIYKHLYLGHSLS